MSLFKCSNVLCLNTEERINQFEKCPTCETVCYCSEGCQIKDWNTNHKDLCETTTCHGIAKLQKYLISTNKNNVTNQETIIKCCTTYFDKHIIKTTEQFMYLGLDIDNKIYQISIKPDVIKMKKKNFTTEQNKMLFLDKNSFHIYVEEKETKSFVVISVERNKTKVKLK